MRLRALRKGARSGVGQTSGDEADAVQMGALHVRKREGPASNRKLEPRQVDQGLADDAPLGRRNAGQRGTFCHSVRSLEHNRFAAGSAFFPILNPYLGHSKLSLLYYNKKSQ